MRPRRRIQVDPGAANRVRAARRIDGVHDRYAVGDRSELTFVASSDPSEKRLELSHQGVAKLVTRWSQEAKGGARETALVSAGEGRPFALRTSTTSAYGRSAAQESDALARPSSSSRVHRFFVRNTVRTLWSGESLSQ